MIMVESGVAGLRLFCFFQAEDGIRYLTVTGVQTCALPIYVELGALVQPLGRQHRLDDLFADGLDEVLLLDARGMLGRQHHGVDGRDHAVFIAQGDLALGVRTQPRQRRVLLLADLDRKSTRLNSSHSQISYAVFCLKKKKKKKHTSTTT